MDIAKLIHIYGEHRKIILIVGANLLGLLVLYGFVSLINRVAVGGPPPSVEAPPQEIVSYMASTKFENQPNATKLELGTKFFNRYAGSPDAVEKFRQEVSSLSDYEKERLRDNVMDMVVEQIAQDSQVYARQQTEQEKKAFIQNRLNTARGMQSMITGGSGGGYQPGGAINRGSQGGSRKNIAADPAFSKGLPKDPPALYKMVLDRTKPGDRARMENYVGDLQKTIQSQKTSQRSQTGR